MKSRINILLTAAVLLTSVISTAQDEFIVNTYKDTTQRDPQIARDLSGNYVIAWQSVNQISGISKGDIYMRSFNSSDAALSGEILVNTFTEGDQERPALSMNSKGEFVIAWSSYSDFTSIYDIKARLYKNFQPLTGEFTVNTFTDFSQTNADVAIGEDGKFAIVWESWFQDGSDRGIYCQLFNEDGSRSGEEFRINTTSLYSQARPAIKYFSNGNFIVVWESWKQDSASPAGYGLYGKIYSSQGTVLKDEFRINNFSSDYQWFGDIETFNDNSFLAAWCSWEQDGHDGGIYLQKFDSDGNRNGNEIQINRTTQYYQWLPRLVNLPYGYAVVWSSWQQDRSREGVFCRIFDERTGRFSFETQVNYYEESFQWEPDIVAGNDENELLIVWSSWGQEQNDYEVVARRITPQFPQGQILDDVYNHTAGTTTSEFMVHVSDSTQLTGNEYRITFETYGNNLKTDSAFAFIRNSATGTYLIERFKIHESIMHVSMTPAAEGFRVEFFPVFLFGLDIKNSYFVNNSGTNLLFTPTNVSVGQKNTAPIDVILIWGSCDTLTDGKYVTPLDTAMGTDGQRNIVTPFRGWNITDDKEIEMLVAEKSSSRNKKWDPGESIVFLTPAPYKTAGNNTHAQINLTVPGGVKIFPSTGDTNYVLTARPLSSADEFTFRTDRANIITYIKEQPLSLNLFDLNQNFPNPFNPTTVIGYSVPGTGLVELNVFNILGEKLKTLVREIKSAGSYRVLFDGSEFASGVYIYMLSFENKFRYGKMLLLK